MPVYDSIVGARLETTKVADPAAADAQFARAVSGEDLSAGDRQRELDALAAIPGVKADFVIESEDGPRYLLLVADGKQQSFDIVDSRSPDGVEPARGTFRPTVRAKVPIDELIEMFQDAGVDEIEVSGEDAAELPYFWPDRDTLLSTLAKAGPLLRGKLEILVEIDDRRYDVEVAGGQVTCVPLHPLCGERTAQVLAIAEIGATEAAASIPFMTPVKQKPAPSYDPTRPLTTGSLGQREDWWRSITKIKLQRYDVPAVIAAVKDEENRDKRYAELRRRMYHDLAKHDTPEVCALWLWALREESDDMAETVTYIGWRLESVIARLPDELRDAEARGDTRTVQRIRRLQSEAR